MENIMVASAKAIWNEKARAWQVHVEWDNGNHLEGDYLIEACDENVSPLALTDLVGYDVNLLEDEWMEKTISQNT